MLLDIMMPSMDGFEVCRQLKANPKTRHVPIIIVTAPDQPRDKFQGLEAGADDFLTKPVDYIALITRVKILARLKMLTDEMLMRANTSERMDIKDDDGASFPLSAIGGRLLLVEDNARLAERMKATLCNVHMVQCEINPQAALISLSEGNFDLLIVSLGLEGSDGLRLCSQVRSLDRIRHLPILMIAEPGDDARLFRGLDIGVNDYLVRPVDCNEMRACVRTQIKRKRYAEHLENRFAESVEMAITDALTGLHNRRYMESHLKTLVKEATQRGKMLSLLINDIDYFKSVNDTHGHDVGDTVLKEFALRIRRNVRGIDLACRMGGEEFVVVMPDTDLAKAYVVAEWLRQHIADKLFNVGKSEVPLNMTASVGVATLEQAGDKPETILKRADQALYCAKRDGRNRVLADAA